MVGTMLLFMGISLMIFTVVAQIINDGYTTSKAEKILMGEDINPNYWMFSTTALLMTLFGTVIIKQDSIHEDIEGLKK
ncbi:MAG: hypothetical protein ACE5Q4_04670 [Nitrosopumilus sp.]